MASDTTLLRTFLIVVAAILLLPFLIMLFMIPIMGMGHIWWTGSGTIWPWLVVGLLCLLVVFGIIYALSQAMFSLRGQREDVALQELRQAYARGELSEEEFEQRRDRLQQE